MDSRSTKGDRSRKRIDGSDTLMDASCNLVYPGTDLARNRYKNILSVPLLPAPV
jgi:hypothetical protein